MSAHRDHARFLEASDGRPIAYYVDDFTPPWRKGPWLLLLHSAMGSSERFFAWMPLLLPHLRVMRMDLRGHGLSHKPLAQEDITLERLTQDAVELLDRLGIARAHIVGNSAGGYVAQQLAIHHPERCLSLVTVGSTPGLTPAARAWFPAMRAEGFTPFLRRTIADRFDPSRTDPGPIAWFLEQTAENDPEALVRFIHHMTTRSWGEDLALIACPTLVIYPGEEPVGGAGAYEPYRRYVRDLEMKAYEHMPHNIADMVPERCVADILDFLRRRCGLGGGAG
jgi:pimeloyl-ACP methyl ester carboxylesterase